MITNTGKNILAKYLVGQTPSYASYIAIGCGPKAVNTDYTFSSPELLAMKNKDSLDFEMLRVPIISRGFINEGDVSKVVLTAELPTEERYEITEVGIFSAGANPVAGSFDSRLVYSFTDTDSWQYKDGTQSPVNIPKHYEPLDGPSENGIINQTDPIFSTNADNRIFTNSTRIDRNERCRVLNNIIAIAGNSSTLAIDSSGVMEATLNSKCIVLSPTSVDFTKNSPTDELRLAFSVVNRLRESTPQTLPDNVKILLEFSHTTNSTTQYAKFQVNIDEVTWADGTSNEDHAFTSNRYVVSSKAFKELKKTSDFKWSDVSLTKIYASVTKSGVPSQDFYVCLEILMFELL